MKEEKSNPYETYAAFPKRKSRNIEQTDNELFSLHCKKTKNDRKKIILKWEASESFKQCENCKVLERINSSYLSLSNSSNYPHSDFLDTLYCEPSKQIMRTAQTKKGMLHGELKYYYPSGQLLALLNFKEDYPNGDFMLFYPNGEIKRKNKYNMGNEIDSAFEYSKNKVLKTLTVWEDSVKFIKQTFWEDGKITQQMELCKGENLAVKMQYGRKQAVSKKIIENRYFNKQGEEISKKQFGKDYPSILPKYDPHKTRVKF
jgi:antitoxin component YwqK of YwqJK toxin-antitoxin module